MDDVVALGDRSQSGSGLGAGRRGRAEGPADLIAASAGLFAVVDEDQHVLSAGRTLHDTLDLAADHGVVTNSVYYTSRAPCSGARFRHRSMLDDSAEPILLGLALGVDVYLLIQGGCLDLTGPVGEVFLGSLAATVGPQLPVDCFYSNNLPVIGRRQYLQRDFPRLL